MAETENRSLVFLDLAIGNKQIGRVVLRLFNDQAPIAAETFRQLCTGEKIQQGNKICYKGTMFHGVIKQYAIYGGAVNVDAYPQAAVSVCDLFKEKNSLKHDKAGTLSMTKTTDSEYGSKFSINIVDMPHMDGTDLVIGEVASGLGVVIEMSYADAEKNIPREVCYIYKCGEIKNGDDWGIAENDESGDPYPIHPEDLMLYSVTFDDTNNASPFLTFTGVRNDSKDNYEQMKIPIITQIKICGNHYFATRDYCNAAKKYTKALRFFDWFDNIEKTCDEPTKKLRADCMLNLATCCTSLMEYKNAINLCDQVVEKFPNNAKAFYRRAQALYHSREFGKSLDDLSKAKALCPNDVHIRNQIIKTQKAKIEHDVREKKRFSNLFDVVGNNDNK